VSDEEEDLRAGEFTVGLTTGPGFEVQHYSNDIKVLVLAPWLQARITAFKGDEDRIALPSRETDSADHPDYENREPEVDLALAWSLHLTPKSRMLPAVEEPNGTDKKPLTRDKSSPILP